MHIWAHLVSWHDLKTDFGCYVVQFSLPLRAWSFKNCSISFPSVFESTKAQPAFSQCICPVIRILCGWCYFQRLHCLLSFSPCFGILSLTWSSSVGYMSLLQIHDFIEIPSSTSSFLSSFWERILSLFCMDPISFFLGIICFSTFKRTQSFPISKNNIHFFIQFQIEKQVPYSSSHFTVQIVR